MLATYTLQIVITGLCAFVPTDHGVTVVLLDAVHNTSGMPCDQAMTHYPQLSTRLAFLDKSLAPKPDDITTGPDGEEVAVFKLDRLSVTLDNLSPVTPFSTKQCLFRGTELPHPFIPHHSQDSRWIVDASHIVPKPQIKDNVLTSPYHGVAALATLTQGVLRTSSLLRDLGNNYIAWQFEPNGVTQNGHIQALADTAIIEMQFDYDPENSQDAPIVFHFTNLGNGTPAPALYLFPTPGSRTMQVSITNLPLQVPSGEVLGPTHFHCYCDLVRGPGDACKDPQVATAATTGAGIMCPMIALQP
jgi:hypothetical protein